MPTSIKTNMRLYGPLISLHSLYLLNDEWDHDQIKRWLEIAQAHLHSAQFYQQQHHADHAYVNFTKAVQIIVNIIPSNRQYPTFAASGNETNKEYIALQKVEQRGCSTFCFAVADPGSRTLNLYGVI